MMRVKSKRSMKSTSILLSIPETIFLPSEIRNITAVSCVTHHEKDENKAKESKDGNQITGNFLCKWSQLPSYVSRWCLVFVPMSH